MIRILVVWEEVPDSCGFIEIGATPEEVELLLSFHNHYVNGETLSEEINNFFYDDKGVLKYKVSLCPITNAHFDHIIITGFIN